MTEYLKMVPLPSWWQKLDLNEFPISELFEDLLSLCYTSISISISISTSISISISISIYPYPYIGYGYGYGCVSGYGYGYGYGYGCVSVDVYVYHRPNLERARKGRLPLVYSLFETKKMIM